MNISARFPFGRLIPWTLFAIAVCDIALRVAPRETVEGFGVNRVILMSPHDSPWRGIYEPNLNVKRAGVCGDLAVMANLPEICVSQVKEFRTDEWNHLNEPGTGLPGVASIALVGDSFTAFSESGFANGFARLLERQSGRRVYNAGRDGFGAPSLTGLRGLLDQLRMRRGCLVYEYSISDGHAYPPPEEGTKRRSPRFSWAIRSPEARSAVRGVEYQLIRQDGLQAGARKLLKRAETGVFLTNPYRGSIVLEPLFNGMQTAIAQPEGWGFTRFSLVERMDSVPQWMAVWRAVKEEMRSRDGELLVVLLPDKLTVYGPLFATPSAIAEEKAEALRILESNARAAGIHVLNLTDPLQGAAASALRKGELLYPPDDGHWGLTARTLAARLVAEAMAAVQPR